ncbi:hypothetical protein CIB95_07655 [Lottiidibacillus patelloidae]|uniref:Uncharacterized protein n=1 Tax=Lottiidibacillus patelloidae TaxID=2670334 RepID=A0A263BUE3_9BACI|nr:hypothetical protein [Lottiidibacillus patelloidae]OZM57330.1 hypothetical protein CIB95_07655 [Lottiidibacillus patelloidae]
MDKYVSKSYLEKDREDELFLRIAQVSQQIEIIGLAVLDKNKGGKEVFERLEIIRQLFAWYVNGDCEESWKRKIQELPKLLTFNEKLQLISTLYICTNIVTRLQDILLPWKDEHSMKNINVHITNEISLKLMFLNELLESYNVKKEYPHLIKEACDPKDWFMN